MEHTIREVSGSLVGTKGNIAIVASRFNEIVVDRLIAGATDILIRHGLSKQQIELIRVPGAYEIPLTCQTVAETGRFAGILALGVVIRGATSHFDYVAGGAANGIMQVQLKTKTPISFGVLTTESQDQAFERAGSKAGNKGAEAAVALLEMIDLLGKIHD